MLGPKVKLFTNSIGALPAHDFPFHDGTVETLLWDKDNWVWYWKKPDGSRKRLRGCTGTLHRCISKGEVLINWAKKVCFLKIRKLLIEKHLGPNGAIELWESELDAAIKEAKKANDEILTDAASVGHMAHEHVEHWIKAVIDGDEAKQRELLALLPVNPDDPEDERAENCVIAALSWADRHNVRFEFTERPVFSREFEYAGTCD